MKMNCWRLLLQFIEVGGRNCIRTIAFPLFPQGVFIPVDERKIAIRTVKQFLAENEGKLDFVM